MKKFKAFIALDATNNKKNIEVVKKLYKLVYGFKVGYRSFYNKDSDKLIAEIKRKNSRLFLDLKLHDIPNTVSSAIESLKNINPDFLTLHISGGEEMLKSALKNIKKLLIQYIPPKMQMVLIQLMLVIYRLVTRDQFHVLQWGA